MTTPRSLEVRITEYRDNLLSIADQLVPLIQQVEVAAADLDVPAHVGPLHDAVKLYRIVADDLTKVISGEELGIFAVNGTLP